MKVSTKNTGKRRFLLVPGGPGLPVAFYRDLIALIEPLGSVETYQQQGVWPTGSATFPRSVAEAADELKEAVATTTDHTTVDDPPLYLVSHSFGAAVVIEALCSGLAVDGAILLNGYSSGEMLKCAIQERAAALPAEFHRRVDENNDDAWMALLVDFWLPRHFCRVPVPQALTDGLSKLNQTYCDHFVGTTFFDPDGAILDWNRDHDLSSIEIPVLFVSGAYDYVAEDTTRRMAAQLPNSYLHFGLNTSHSPWIEAPDETFKAVKRFVAHSQYV